MEQKNVTVTIKNASQQPFKKSRIITSEPGSLDVFWSTPRTNCGKCGYESCIAFSYEVSKGEAETKQCPNLSDHVYWILPNTACSNECGYKTCDEFTQKVATNTEIVKKCPYVLKRPQHTAVASDKIVEQNQITTQNVVPVKPVVSAKKAERRYQWTYLIYLFSCLGMGVSLIMGKINKPLSVWLFFAFCGIAVLFRILAKKAEAVMNRLKNPADRAMPMKQLIKQVNPPIPVLDENLGKSRSILEQGQAFAKEIEKANELIPDDEISRNLNSICQYVNDIFIYASKEKSSERQIRKFSNIYLPQTLKLCNIYIDLDTKRVQTEEVIELKDQIGKSIENARYAFARLNDNLISQSSIDIKAEVKTFDDILAIDGLLNRHELVMPEQDEEKTEIK
ncbi:MAG: 5-bromo-4-chloroindolyl phosphate hydrolysis family protein [Anaerofustis sp.]